MRAAASPGSVGGLTHATGPLGDCLGPASWLKHGTVSFEPKPSSMHARVTVTLKSGILDPQGKAIEGALHAMGLPAIDGVRQGKLFDVTLAGTDREAAERELRSACERLLANLVIEDYAIEMSDSMA